MKQYIIPMPDDWNRERCTNGFRCDHCPMLEFMRDRNLDECPLANAKEAVECGKSSNGIIYNVKESE